MQPARRQYLAFAALSAVAAGLTAVLSRSHRALFQPYFGGSDPLLVVTLTIVLGAVSLAALHSRSRFEVFKGRATVRGVAFSAGLATLLAVAMILADFLFIRFPEEMNVPPPEALLFYPAIGYVVELLFHTLPLATLILILGKLLKPAGTQRVVWLGILLTSLLEPTFQVVFPGEPLSWTAAYVWVHVAVLNLLQLYVFRRYDFVSMYSFRLVYYLYWHIVWGVVRLRVLF